MTLRANNKPADGAGALDSTAAVLAIGDEIVVGQSLDTNSKWLAGRLTDAGLTVVGHETAPDDQEAIAGAMRRLARHAGVVIVTGGLGPTADDLTRGAMARAMGASLEIDKEALQTVREWFDKDGRAMPEANAVQAMRPENARVLPNPNGTAPGLVGELSTDRGRAVLVCLPGPPGEMRPMFERHVGGLLPEPKAGTVIRTRLVHAAGLGESDAAGRLGGLLDRDANPLVGITASAGVVTCRIRYTGPAAEACGAVERTEADVRNTLGRRVFGVDGDTLAAAVLRCAREHNAVVTTVESCTGGGLGAAMTAEPGASDVYAGGWVTYANAMKCAGVGVSPETIDTHGAVSAQAAREMVLGGLAGCATLGEPARRVCCAVTGVAGPGGGTDQKPVGTVWIAVAVAEHNDAAPAVDVRRFGFPGGKREGVRTRAVNAAMTMLRAAVAGETEDGLLWQCGLGG